MPEKLNSPFSLIPLSLPVGCITAPERYPLRMEMQSVYEGNGEILLVDDRSVLVSKTEVCTDGPVEVTYSIPGETIVLIMCLQGNIKEIAGTLQGGESNILYVENTRKVRLEPDRQSISLLEIFIEKDIFLNLLIPECAVQSDILQKIRKGPGYLNRSPILITSKMAMLIEELSGGTGTAMPYLRHFMIKARVLELLMFQLEQAEQFRCADQSCKLVHIKAITEAKSILERNLASPPTIPQLSKQVGMNEYDLKKRFKEVFGTTVFGYVSDVRMQKARILLKEGRTVSEVAFAIGYKNPQHFTAAFKKKYNILPSALK